MIETQESHSLAILDNRFPAFQEADFINDINKEVTRPDIQHWRTPSIKTILKLGWAVFLRFLSQFQTLDSYAEVFEEDGELLADAIQNDAFSLIRNDVIAADTFFQEVSVV